MAVTIRQGDDTNALGQEITLILDTDIDLTGFKAAFQVGEFRQEFLDITSKRLSIIIPKEETKKLKCGPNFGGLKIYDKSGRAYTAEDDINFFVEPEIVRNGRL